MGLLRHEAQNVRTRCSTVSERHPHVLRFTFHIPQTLERLLPRRSSALATACSQPTSVTEFGILFPRQSAGVDIMEAEYTGRLVEGEGCLQVNREEETNYVLVWPFDYGLTTIKGVLAVRDGSGQVKVRVGEEIYVSGGEQGLEGLAMDKRLKEELGARCPGEYWRVGSEVRPLESSVVSGLCPR